MQTIIFLDNSLALTANFDCHIVRVYEMIYHLNALSDMLEFGNTVNNWKKIFTLLLRLLINDRKVVFTYSINGNSLNQVTPFIINTYRIFNMMLLRGHLKK